MNILHLFQHQSVQEVLGIETNLSPKMYSAIELWQSMATGQAPWNTSAPSCGIVEQIAGELKILVAREIGLAVQNKTIQPVMEYVNKNVDRIVEYIALFGSCLVRPIFANGKLQCEIISLGNYLPVRYDFDGTLTSALIFKHLKDGNKKWLLAEYHVYEHNTHRVTSKLYKEDYGVLHKVPLTACAQTKDITPEYIWQNVPQPMLIEFRNHAANKIDGSSVPVSLFSGAEDLIQQADEQFARMNWEQEAGQKIVFADRDLFQKRKTRDGAEVGARLTPSLHKLIVQVEGDGSTDGKKITEYSPALRVNEQNEMFQQILRRIENTCNIGKGTLSDMESVQQTATQYSGGRQKLYAIVDFIEDEIEAKYHTCANVFAYMAAAYKLGPFNADIAVTWNDDSTRKDMQAAKLMAINEINTGIKSAWEYRRDFYGEDEATAKANVPPAPAAATPFDFGA